MECFYAFILKVLNTLGVMNLSRSPRRNAATGQEDVLLPMIPGQTQKRPYKGCRNTDNGPRALDSSPIAHTNPDR
jgi:hypothetical protein